MGFSIIDGRGTGNAAQVSDEGMLKTLCITETMEKHTNKYHGASYTMLFDATPTGAGDCFLYIKNEDVTNMIIEGMGIKLAADEYFDVKLGADGTPVGGTDVTPANLNAGSGNIASGTFQKGNDITGLSNGNTIYRIYHVSSAGTTTYNFDQNIVLPKNTNFSLWIQTGTTALAGWIDFFYHE